jgi:hypothetical protein
MRTSVLALAISGLLALAVPAVAAAPKAGPWKGRNAQTLTVAFSVKAGKIVAFRGSVRMFCTGGGGFEFRAIYQRTAMPIRAGRFKFKGKEKDGTEYSITGRISGGKASGTMSHSATHYDAAEQQFQFCNSNDVKWTATPARR